LREEEIFFLLILIIFFIIYLYPVSGLYQSLKSSCFRTCLGGDRLQQAEDPHCGLTPLHSFHDYYYCGRFHHYIRHYFNILKHSRRPHRHRPGSGARSIVSLIFSATAGKSPAIATTLINSFFRCS
jgi:hypothetical protein